MEFPSSENSGSENSGDSFVFQRYNQSPVNGSGLREVTSPVTNRSLDQECLTSLTANQVPEPELRAPFQISVSRVTPPAVVVGNTVSLFVCGCLRAELRRRMTVLILMTVCCSSCY